MLGLVLWAVLDVLDPFSSYPLVVKLDVEVQDESEFSDEPSPDDDDGERLFFFLLTNLS